VYAAPLKAGLEFLLTVPTAYLPQQTKNGFAGDPGRGGLNNSALRAGTIQAIVVPFAPKKQVPQGQIAPTLLPK